jgi:hypothetical protein
MIMMSFPPMKIDAGWWKLYQLIAHESGMNDFITICMEIKEEISNVHLFPTYSSYAHPHQSSTQCDSLKISPLPYQPRIWTFCCKLSLSLIIILRWRNQRVLSKSCLSWDIFLVFSYFMINETFIVFLENANECRERPLFCTNHTR